MSQRSGANRSEETSAENLSDESILLELLGWGRLITSLVEVIDPFCQLVDLLQTDHPLKSSDKPLGAVVRCFGRGSGGEAFLTWWTGGDQSLPKVESREAAETAVPLGLAHRWRAAELHSEAQACFEKFHREWNLRRDRLRNAESGQETSFSKPLSDETWEFALNKLPIEESLAGTDGGAQLDEAIERVRSYFAPLESPLFGMDTEMLAHHVQETIPRERPAETLTPIVPLFGKGHLQQAFPSTAQLPAHLRVILHRLLRSQENQDLVTSLLATLEGVDFTLRFATSLAQGTWAQIAETDFAGDFNPTTAQIISDLTSTIEFLTSHRSEPRAQAAVNLFYQGPHLHPFLQWCQLGDNSRLLSWMMEAEDVIRNDHPARAAVLLSEMMEPFNEWISELVLLCSSWDLVTHIRQDGYLQISLARGDVWLSCKPLIDPTRYSVWLDRSELTLVNKGGALQSFRDAKEPVESLDQRITVADDDPPFLHKQLSALLRAHQQGQILALGRALFFGLEYLVRLHASLAGGFLRHFYHEAVLVDPVLKESGSLEHTIFFLSYSQRLMDDFERDEAYLLRQVFFDQDRPREFTLWLGLEGGVPGPLQGLLGWSLSLMRPDAKTRLDEVRGQVERLSSLFADFLEESRRLWRVAPLKTDANGEGAEAVVLTFPSGLTIRGIPDVAVGPRLERGRRSVVVCREESEEEEFSDWEGAEQEAPETDEVASESCTEEPSWPSFFDDETDSGQDWTSEHMEAISRICQARSFSGPEARPRMVAQEVADLVTSSRTASLMFCKGESGAGKTFLCRTLTNPSCSPLPDDFPVLYLRVDRFPRTRLATVVERLNDHIASEQSLERFEWCSVPLDSLKALGGEVARLADDLSALGLASENLGNRLSSYLRHLKKLNGGREFLLILDGFDQVPLSIVPRALPRGVHLLITGTALPEQEEHSTPYLERRVWKLDEVQKETFFRQLQGLQLKDDEKQKAWERFGGSLFLARVFRDLRDSDLSYPITGDTLEELFARINAQFTAPEKHRQFLRLLAVLGLYDRPVPLATLQKKVFDSEVVSRGVRAFPSLFSFWEHPNPSLGLSHRIVFEQVKERSTEVESVAGELAESFLENPRRGELLPALSWFAESDNTVSLVDRFFAESGSAGLWREELASLQERGLFFHRVAMLDAIAQPLAEAVSGGAGHLLEELAWVHNARGLSLLELGLVEEAIPDFQKAIELFTEMFEAGDIQVLQALASANSRLSEAYLKNEDPESATQASDEARQLLSERDLADEDEAGLAELRIRVMLQSARSSMALGKYQEALDKLSSIESDLEHLSEEQIRRLGGECFLAAARAMTGLGLLESALEQVDVAVDYLLVASTAELGLQALTLRARLLQRLERSGESDRDYQRAISIIRYQVAVGRLDLEPVLAYTAAQATLVAGEGTGSPEALSEFVDWARRRIRFEGRTDLRGLLAYLLLTRGAAWKKVGKFSRAASDLRGATEQYELLSRETSGERDKAAWTALRRSFRNLTALYLSLDEPHLALICGRRALELGRRGGPDSDSAEESVELSLQSLSERSRSEAEEALSQVRFFQLGKLYFHLGEAARRVGLTEDGATYYQRSARAFAQSCSDFEEVPEALAAEYALVLKMAAQAAFEDKNLVLLEEWVDELASLPDGYLTPFDQYRFWRWSGHLEQARGDHKRGLDHLDRALRALESQEDHPRWRTLEAEVLLDIGRAHSLTGEHPKALQTLERAAQKAHDALFAEGDENRDLLVLCALHSAVAQLRAGQTSAALDKLRVLVSLRPSAEVHDLESLATDWVEAWKSFGQLSHMEMLKALGQLSELGDWLLRTPLGEWYRELVSKLVMDDEFSTVIMSSSRIDRVLETYLVLTFSRVGRDTHPESHPELDRLLAAKFRAFDSENRDLEAELLMGHLLPLRLTPEAGKILLRRSEMALLRGDRGLAIVDLLRAIDGGGECRLRAHLRLSEFLQSRSLQVAATHHLLRALQATDGQTEELSSLCGRFNRVLTSLSKSGAKLELSFFAEYFRVLGCLEPKQLKPTLEVAWLRPARDLREWPKLLDMSLDLVLPWQRGGHDKAADWDFLEQLLDRTLLCQGRLEPALLEKLGQLLAATLSGDDLQHHNQAGKLWERFVSFLPGLGKRNALELLQRLFDYTLRTEQPSNQSHVEEFLRLIEEEKRILVQPR